MRFWEGWGVYDHTPSIISISSRRDWLGQNRFTVAPSVCRPKVTRGCAALGLFTAMTRTWRLSLRSLACGMFCRLSSCIQCQCAPPARSVMATLFCLRPSDRCTYMLGIKSKKHPLSIRDCGVRNVQNTAGRTKNHLLDLLTEGVLDLYVRRRICGNRSVLCCIWVSGSRSVAIWKVSTTLLRMQ